MKSLVFDSGPVISLTTSNLLWLLRPLKKKYGGRFLITEGVREEIVDRPLKSKRFKFEALQILDCINEGILEIVKGGDVESKCDEILDLANTLFLAKGHPIKIIHKAETEALAVCLLQGSDAVVIDERTTRLVVEDPGKLQYLLKKKLHTPIQINQTGLEILQGIVGNIKVIRSVELATIGFEMGLLDSVIHNSNTIVLEEPRKTLIEGVLWDIKLNGCAVSEQEIKRIMKAVL